jgi:trehalose-6-phosphate synthase
MLTTHPNRERLVIVLNRRPIVLDKEADGRWRLKPGSGGLVTAMAPMLEDRGGVWIGWPGSEEKPGMELNGLLRGAVKDSGYTFKPLPLSAEELDGYYYGFANEIL